MHGQRPPHVGHPQQLAPPRRRRPRGARAAARSASRPSAPPRRPSPRPAPDCGAGRPAPSARMTVGSAHTQWCDHDTGETTRPNSATQISASVGLAGRGQNASHRPDRQARAPRSRPASTARSGCSRPGRAGPARRRCSGWCSASRVPIRSVWRTVVVQYSPSRARPARTRAGVAATNAADRGQRGAAVAAQHEVQQEHRRRQLQRDRHARAAGRAATGCGAARSRRSPASSARR